MRKKLEMPGLVWLVATVMALALGACDDGGEKTTDTSVSDVTTSDTEADTSTTPDTPEDATTTETTEDILVDKTPDVVPDVLEETTAEVTDVVEDFPIVANNCSEASLTECVTNYDCQDSERCQDVGSAGLEVPCCVTAARGTTVPGQPCTSSIDCTAGICLSRNGGPELCSEVCADVSDCPAEAPVCSTIPFMGDFCTQ